MSNDMNCEKCGTQMQYFRDKSTCGWTCPKCGWGLVTTYQDPLDLDECVYTILIPPQDASLKAIKCISSMFSVNYIEARKKLLDGSLHASGNARFIRDKALILTGCSVEYRIEPQFPHPLDS